MAPELLASSPECEIRSSRILDTDIGTVYRAWTEPNHLKNWWGPKGFTNTFNEFDLQPGGRWSFVMHGPDKGNYVNECEFIKIEKPTLIAWKRHSKPIFNVVVTLEAINSQQTKIDFSMIFPTEEECNKVKKFAVDKNEENFDKLEAEILKILP